MEVAPLRTGGTTGSRTGDISSEYISLYTSKVIPSIGESSDTICGKSWDLIPTGKTQPERDTEKGNVLILGY